MADIITPVPVFDITIPRGSSRIVRFTIKQDTGGGMLNVDLSLPGIQVIFTAKLRDSDALPQIQKSYVSPGTTPHLSPNPGGITASHIDTNADTVLDTWVADLGLVPGDTESLNAPLLHYDVWLFNAAGQEVPVCTGTLKLSPTVLRP